MEWDSPWGKGAPGWHLECSVMSEELLGLPFDIHTGGIDHREIHHPNEIAQNQAFCGAEGHACGSGATIWMHNNFLIDRTGKMSKSSGQFLRLPLLIEKGVHPLAYRLMCLQAHYRSELEFSWDNLAAALTRLKRLVLGAQKLKEHEDERDISHPLILQAKADFEAAMSDDLNTPKALITVEQVIAMKRVCDGDRYRLVMQMDEVLGLDLLHLDREDLRIRPADAQLTEEDVLARMMERQAARDERDFERSDRIRDELTDAGIELMDGDPLGWEWKLSL
jgi:cysteinyl-tRNA synthetase